MSHRNVLLRSLADLGTLDFPGFHERVISHLTQGDRLLSLFGSPDGDSAFPILHAVFLQGDQGIEHFTGRRQGAGDYHSLTARFPELHCFEREVHEQYGLAMDGHPWLKPIRFEGKNLGRMNDYPFYKLEGKEVYEVGVGPIHAGVIEPGHFRFMCLSLIHI